MDTKCFQWNCVNRRNVSIFRAEYIEKSRHLQNQLRDLRSEIEVLKVDEKQTELDQLHEEQVRMGETKYSTLKKVKSGSTKARVAFYEELWIGRILIVPLTNAQNWMDVRPFLLKRASFSEYICTRVNVSTMKSHVENKIPVNVHMSVRYDV